VLLILRRVFLQGCNLIFKHEQLEAGWKWTSGGGGFGLQFFCQDGSAAASTLSNTGQVQFLKQQKKKNTCNIFFAQLDFFSVFIL
jgi:hypothetical protein